MGSLVAQTEPEAPLHLSRFRREYNYLVKVKTSITLPEDLLQAMIACLSESTSVEMGTAGRLHSAVIARFEDFLAANLGHPLYVLELCAANGVACLYDLYMVDAHSDPGMVTSVVL